MIAKAEFSTRIARTLVAIGMWLATSLAHGIDFRVDTDVNIGSDEVPVAQFTTWLTEHRVYDLHQKNVGNEPNASSVDSVTIFDLQSRAVLLLSPSNGVRTQIPFDDLLQFVAATTTLTTGKSPIVQFASAPTFKQSYHNESQQLRLDHDLMSYSAKLKKAPEEAVVQQYRVFTDWAARLNTLAGLPPSARLKLNLAIARQESVPVSIRRKTKAENEATVEAVSRHTYRWQLSDEDRIAMEKFDRWAESLQFIDYAAFQSRSNGTSK